MTQITISSPGLCGLRDLLILPITYCGQIACIQVTVRRSSAAPVFTYRRHLRNLRIRFLIVHRMGSRTPASAYLVNWATAGGNDLPTGFSSGASARAPGGGRGAKTAEENQEPQTASRRVERTGWGLHASHLGPRFYGVDSTITPCRGTYSLRPIAFLLRIKMIEKPSAISRFRRPACSFDAGQGTRTGGSLQPKCGGFLPGKTKILVTEKEPANDHEISLILQENRG
jgi:hypothetical protein